MSVRQSLLAILAQGPCYGYQLRTEFDRRTGSTWPLNVGQIYNTLDRLERDGLVRKGDADEHGHVYWEITDAGGAAARAWLDAPVPRPTGTRDDLAIKLAIAATLPDVDVAALIRAQRAASQAQRAELAASADSPADEPEALARALVLDAMLASADAELDWLDRAEERIARHPVAARALPLSRERPRRGRPAARAGAAAD
jgi:DNA-binding PadR family transcriptional regulator